MRNCRHLHVNFFLFKAQNPRKIVVHDDLPAARAHIIWGKTIRVINALPWFVLI